MIFFDIRRIKNNQIYKKTNFLKLMTFPELEIGIPRTIDKGTFCAFLDLKNGKGAKVALDYDQTPHQILVREYEIAKKLYKAGISVPKPYGVYFLKGMALPGCGFIVQSRIGFVMDIITGIRGDRVEDNLKSRVDELILQELRKVESARFNHVDVKPSNSLYDPRNDKIYLIDFDGWS